MLTLASVSTSSSARGSACRSRRAHPAISRAVTVFQSLPRHRQLLHSHRRHRPGGRHRHRQVRPRAPSNPACSSSSAPAPVTEATSRATSSSGANSSRARLAQPSSTTELHRRRLATWWTRAERSRSAWPFAVVDLDNFSSEQHARPRCRRRGLIGAPASPAYPAQTGDPGRMARTKS